MKDFAVGMVDRWNTIRDNVPIARGHRGKSQSVFSYPRGGTLIVYGIKIRHHQILHERMLSMTKASRVFAEILHSTLADLYEEFDDDGCESFNGGVANVLRHRLSHIPAMISWQYR